jgi:hypothetical protein
MTVSSGSVRGPSATTRNRFSHGRPGRDGILLGLVTVLVIGLISGAAFARRPSGISKSSPVSVVRLAVGSENVPFFRDKQVRMIFSRHHIVLQVTGFGSQQLATVDLSSYDAVVPSSELSADQLQATVSRLKGEPRFPLFESPLAIVTYHPVVACLERLGLTSQDSSGIWWFKVAAYLRAVESGESWSKCGASVSPLSGKILLTTTDPRCSNSGEMFAADASYVANGSSAVADPRTAVKVGMELAPMITGQGLMESTTMFLLDDYLNEGKGSVPMGLVYESAFLGEEITTPSAISRDMVLMYLNPDVFSSRVLMPLDAKGRLVSSLFADTPALSQVAQDTYGFRSSGLASFQEGMTQHRIFGKRIAVPAQFPSGARPPQPDILQKVIDAAEPSTTSQSKYC